MSDLILPLGICLGCHVIRCWFSRQIALERIDPRSRPVVIITMLAMAGMWFSWFFLVEADPWLLGLPPWLRMTGLALFILGVLLFATPLLHLRRFENTERLVTGGVFRYLRHPMYTGFILWLLGYPTYLDSGVGLITAPLWITSVLLWRFFEEKSLERQFPEYPAYRQQTWF